MLSSFIARNYAMYALANQYQATKLIVPTVPLQFSSTQRHFDLQAENAMLRNQETSQNVENKQRSARDNDAANSSELKFSIDRILAKDNSCCAGGSGEMRTNMNIDIEGDNIGLSGASVGDLNDAGIDVTDEALKYSWLQCTRYKPPKLQRIRKKDGGKKRKLGRNPRVPFTQHQVASLEQKFCRTHYLSSMDVAELSTALNLTETRVKIWFQNRRARERRDRDSKQRTGQEPVPARTQTSGIRAGSPSNNNNSWILAPSGSPTSLAHFHEGIQHASSAFSVVQYKRGCNEN